MCRGILRLLLLLLPCLLVGGVVQADEPPSTPARATAEDEEIRALRREILIQDAKRALGDGAFRVSDAEALRRALRDDERFLKAQTSPTEEEAPLLEKLARAVHHRRIFLGVPAGDPLEESEASEEDDEAAPLPDAEEHQHYHGALSQAQALLRWLRGEEVCGVWVRIRRGEKVEQEHEYKFPVHRPPPPPPKPKPELEPSEAEGAKANEGEKPKPAGGEPVQANPPDAPGGPPGEEEPSAAPDEAEAADDPEATTATSSWPKDDSLPSWVDWVVAQEGGRLIGKSIEPEVCSTATDLLDVIREQPDYLPAGRSNLRRFAIATDEEHVFAYNRPYLHLRGVLSTERLGALAKETPTRLLTDESTVREKARRADRYEARAAARHAERDRVLGRLDDIAAEIEDWRGVAATLSGEIQAEKHRLEAAQEPAPEPSGEGEGEGEPATPKPLPRTLLLRVREAQESTVSMELRLLLHTVLRATERLEILEGLAEQEEGEARAAKSKHGEFAGELAASRSRRQLSRLRMQASDVGTRREELENLEERTPRQALRFEALTAIGALNAVVQDVVDRRGRLSKLAANARKTRASSGGDESTEKPEEARADPAKSKTDGGEPQAPTGPRLNVDTLHPEDVSWGVDVLEVFRRDLSNAQLHGAFNASLVAKHFAVAADRANLLRAALVRAGNDAELRKIFNDGLVRSRKALEALREDRDYAIGFRAGPRWVDDLERDFDFAITNLAKQRARFQELLDHTLVYRRELLQQGKRSLAIRVEGDVDPEALLLALEETVEGVKYAGRWFGGEVSPSFWDFVKARWWQVLLLIGIAVAVVGIVVFVRGGLDRWLDARAARTPDLRWVGASVKEERRAAQERQQREREAREAAEEALQAQTKLPPPPPRNEDIQNADAEAAAADAAESDSEGRTS